MDSKKTSRETSTISSSSQLNSKTFESKEVQKEMEENYDYKVKLFKNELKRKYDGYVKSPESNRDYDYFRKHFMKNYGNSGKRWKHYWEEKMDEKYDKV